MRQGHLEARLYIGNHIELVGIDDNKSHLVVLLSSRLEDERPGVSGDIYDNECGRVVYRCCRTSY